MIDYNDLLEECLDAVGENGTIEQIAFQAQFMVMSAYVSEVLGLEDDEAEEKKWEILEQLARK